MLTIESPLSVGQFAGKWASYNAPPDLPYDQREEDGGSLVFDTDVLTERCEILGAPVVNLDVTASEPVAMVAARLSDVAPDGAATRVTYGLLNLTHRDSHDSPQALEPGQRYRVRVRMNGVAQAFPPGHRIRLSLSTSYWPLAWPPPRPVRLHVYAGSSTLALPVRRVTESDEAPLRAFEEPEGAEPISITRLQPGDHRWMVTRDLVGCTSVLEIVKDAGVVRYDAIGLEVARRAWERYSSVAHDFSSVRGETEWTMSFSRAGWNVRSVTHTELTCTETEFHLHARLDGYEGDQRTFSRNWHRTIPRDCL